MLAISAILAQVANAPTKATMNPYNIVGPPPFTKAVRKKGRADSQVLIIVVVKARIVTNPKRLFVCCFTPILRISAASRLLNVGSSDCGESMLDIVSPFVLSMAP